MPHHSTNKLSENRTIPTKMSKYKNKQVQNKLGTKKNYNLKKSQFPMIIPIEMCNSYNINP